MLISIQIPVIKGGWLKACIDSVLTQTVSNWHLSILWDGGDELSRSILEELEKQNNPRVSVYFQDTRGIAHSRRFLTENSPGDYFLPVDDDDIIAPNAVEIFAEAASRMLWAGIIRSKRGFIDEKGEILEMQNWFPFEPRHYSGGMTCDLYNQTQPYLIKKSVYNKTTGWEGFPEYYFAGADCDMFTKIEELAEIELIDDCLYYYRINPERTSNKLGNEAAEDMWRRLADKTIARRSLPLKRINDTQPFEYERLDTPLPTIDMIDFIIPFWESNDEEVYYEFSRPSNYLNGSCFPVSGDHAYRQKMTEPLDRFNRLELVCSSNEKISGEIKVSLYTSSKAGHPVATARHRITDAHMAVDFVSMDLDTAEGNTEPIRHLKVEFHPYHDKTSALLLHVWIKRRARFWQRKPPQLWMRLFKHSPGYSKRRLDKCIKSLKDAGISDDAIIVIEKKQSCATNRNEGLGIASRPLICFVDDDVEVVADNLFEVLLEQLHLLNADIVGPKIVTDNDTIFCADPFFNDDLSPAPRGFGETDKGQYDYRSVVPWLPTTFLLMKREVYLSVGGFDENYVGSQHEDVDLCLKARSRGFKMCYIGNVKVRHYNCSRNNCHARNFDYFMKRWSRHSDYFDSSRMTRI